MPTSTNLILSDVPLFLQKIFVSLGNFQIPFQAGLHEVFLEKNRIQNATISNVGIASVLFLIPLARQQLKSSLIYWSILPIPWMQKAVRKLIKKGAKSKSDEIIRSHPKATLLKQIRLKTRACRGHLEYLDDMITQTEVELYVRIKPYYEFVSLSVPCPA